jgi:hypothetical protein
MQAPPSIWFGAAQTQVFVTASLVAGAIQETGQAERSQLRVPAIPPLVIAQEPPYWAA